ncbi:MAG: hypothetical protein IJ387_12935, partial [Thermoguttaceae bacterium]|nr:hypothetical protein [Thermoguttaceae bacterium]
TPPAAFVKISVLRKIGVFPPRADSDFSPFAAPGQETQKTDVAKRRFRVRRQSADLGKTSTIQRRKLSQNSARTRRADRQSRRDRFNLAA